MSEADELEAIRERKSERLAALADGDGVVDPSESEDAEDVESAENAADGEYPAAPVHVEGSEHLQSLVDAHGVVLVDFYADWCGPCKMLEPTVEEIAAETDTVVAKVDIDELQTLARDNGVRSVPTLQFYAGGEQVESVVGVQDKEQLTAIIDRVS